FIQRQPPCQILRLVRILDDGQVEIEQQVEGPASRQSLAEVVLPALPECLEQTPAQAGQSNVRVNLIEADFDVPPADAPAANDVVLIVGAAKQLAKPSAQGALEALDLLRSASDDLSRPRVTLDLGIEVVNECRKVRF